MVAFGTFDRIDIQNALTDEIDIRYKKQYVFKIVIYMSSSQLKIMSFSLHKLRKYRLNLQKPKNFSKMTLPLKKNVTQ